MSESRKAKTILENELWKNRIASEVTAAKTWDAKWGWMLDEYKIVQDKLKEITENSLILTKIGRKPEADTRSIKPIPETVNHEYGWIPTKEEFRLEKYGPDVYKPKPLLD